MKYSFSRDFETDRYTACLTEIGLLKCMYFYFNERELIYNL